MYLLISVYFVAKKIVSMFSHIINVNPTNCIQYTASHFQGIFVFDHQGLQIGGRET